MHVPPTCVIVLGPESTGSKLVARTCAHVLGIHAFGTWNAKGWSEGDASGHRVCHRSLPYGMPPTFPDVESIVAGHQASHRIRFVLTTRDRTLSEDSRRERFGKSSEQVRDDSERAREILAGILRSEHPSLLWSYETFMFLRGDYLDLLYRHLGVESDFVPELVDANARRLGRRDG